MTIPNISVCAALPRVVNGAGCVHNISTTTSQLSQTELLDLLDTQPNDRTCIPAGQVLSSDGKNITDPGVPACADDQGHGIAVVLPKRGASIIIPPNDYSALSIALQTACRDLGSKCSYAQASQTTQVKAKLQKMVQKIQ